MKRLLWILLIAALCLTLCACGQKAGESPAEQEEIVLPSPVVPSSEPWTAAPESTAYPPTPEPTPDTRSFHRVEITPENWTVYFQLREIPLFSITSSGVIANVCQTYCVVLRDEYLDQVKSDGDYSVSFVFGFDLYYNTLKVDTKSYTYGHTDDTMFEVSAEKPAVFDRHALRYSAYGTDYSRYSGYSNAFFSGWANINMVSKVWSGFYIDLSQVKLVSVSGYLELAD